VRKKVRKFITDIREGKGITNLAAGVGLHAETAIVKYLTENTDLSDVEGELEKLDDRAVDIGTIIPDIELFGGNKDYRIILPKGEAISKKKLTANLRTIAEDWKKRTGLDTTIDDLKVDNVYKNGDFAIIVQERKSGRIIAEITAKTIHIFDPNRGSKVPVKTLHMEQ
jgi:hypothetical protein